MIDRIVVFILDRESTDLFCKIRLNCQNTVLERMLKLIAQIFKIRVVAADGIVLELPAAVIELHDARAVNGFFDVKTVKKERGLRVLIGAHVSTAAGVRPSSPIHRLAVMRNVLSFTASPPLFSQITGFSRSKLGGETVFI